MIARAIYDDINRFVLPVIAREVRFVPLAGLVSKDFTLAALHQAKQRGRLAAIQTPDGVWQSMHLEVNDYLRNKGKHRSGTVG